MDVSLDAVRAAKKRHEAEWLGVPGVAAVGIGQGEDGGPLLVVSVEADSERIRQRIPAEVEGVPVEVRTTGPMRTL